MLRRRKSWMACWTVVSVATTAAAVATADRTTTTTGFIVPITAPLDLPSSRTTVRPTAAQSAYYYSSWAAPPTTRRTTTMRRSTVRMGTTTTMLCAKKRSKKEEEAAKKSDISNSDFFQSVSGFFKEAEEQQPSKDDDKEGGFLSNLRRKSKTKEDSKKKQFIESSSSWNLFAKAAKDPRSSGDTPLSDAPNGEGRSSANIFKEAAERVMAEASKKGISSRDLRQQKDSDGKKLKQPTKAAAKVSESSDSESSNSSILRRMQDLLPRYTSNSDEEKESKPSQEFSNPLMAVQKIAGSVLKINGDEKVKEEWVPVFPKTRIMPGEMVPVTVAGIDLLVIASNDGQSLYCIANSCPHLGTPLETGQLTRLPIEESSVSSPVSETTTRAAFGPPQDKVGLILSETDLTNILSQDGCEDCIVCPLHKTAFALQSGEVRGEWCPYPPVLGKIMGTVKQPTAAAVFDIRTKGKNIEVRLNSIVSPREDTKR